MIAELWRASRPFSWINTALPFLAVAWSTRHGWSLAIALGALYFLAPYNLLLYGINDLFDYDSDRLNPRKGGTIEGALVGPSRAPLLMAATLVTNVPLLLGLILAGGSTPALALLVTVSAALAYSVPPVRTKVHPFLDSITSSLHFVLPAACGGILAGAALADLPWRLLAAFFLWGMASHALGAIQDVPYDRRAGIGSIATVLGARSTAIFSLAGYGAALLLVVSAPWPAPVAAVALLPYFALAGSCLTGDSERRARRAWRGFLGLNLLAGFLITQVLLRSWGADSVPFDQLLAWSSILTFIAILWIAFDDIRGVPLPTLVPHSLHFAGTMTAAPAPVVTGASHPLPPTLAGSHPTRRAPRAVVIGSGLGGLATAIRLLAAGMQVTVLEGQPTPGGRASRIREGGFTFDTGPSLITMPDVVEDLFAAAGTTTAQHLRLHALNPFYRISWEGEERSFLFSGNLDAMRRQIDGFDPRDGARFAEFVASSRRIHEEAVLAAGQRSFLRLGDFLPLVPSMARLGALRSVESYVGRYFRDSHVRQAFDFHPLFIGGAPFRVPAVYAALAYLQLSGGVWYAKGGVYSLVEALACLVRQGGELHCSRSVAEILHDGRRVFGVRTTDGEKIEADIVVSNADVVTTPQLLKRRANSPKLTMSCYLLYLGTSREFPQLHHHTLLVGSDYRGFIRDVTVGGRIPNSLCLYLHAPSRTERSMAAPGGESITVLMPVPNLSHGHEWADLEPVLRERVLDTLEADSGLGLRGLRQSIVVERAWTPLDFRDRFGAAAGNAFGPEPTLFQSAYFRQPNRDRALAGLYYAGAGTHPGAGIPGVLMGAAVTAGLVRQEIAAW